MRPIQRFSKIFLLALIFGFLLMDSNGLSLAQEDSVAVSLLIQEGQSPFFRNIVSEFEAGHPDIKVHLIESQSCTCVKTWHAGNIEGYLNEFEQLAQVSDVHLVNNYGVFPEATRAGYVLNLASFIQKDVSFDVPDFYPPIWESFQWDGGVWALPVKADIHYVLLYNPKAFDEAGLAYPNGKWSLADLARAIRVLARKDAQGKTIRYGIDASDLDMYKILGSLMAGKLYDDTQIPNKPHLNQTEVANFLDEWKRLKQDDLIGPDPSTGALEAPMRIGAAMYTGGMGTGTDIASVLPGGKVALLLDAVMISSSTQHPQQAYELARFLTTRSEFGYVPARRSVAAAMSQKKTDQIFNLPPDRQVFIEQNLANAIPTSDFRYADYLVIALQKMVSDGISANAALDLAQTQAINSLQSADRRKTQALPATMSSGGK